MTAFNDKDCDEVIDALRKQAFAPAPGGNMDPAAQAGGAQPMPPGAAPQGMPADPNAMAAGQPPMDPAMMGGDPAMAGMMGGEMGGAAPQGMISIADVAKLFKLFKGETGGDAQQGGGSNPQLEARLARIEAALQGQG